MRWDKYQALRILRLSTPVESRPYQNHDLDGQLILNQQDLNDIKHLQPEPGDETRQTIVGRVQRFETIAGMELRAVKALSDEAFNDLFPKAPTFEIGKTQNQTRMHDNAAGVNL